MITLRKAYRYRIYPNSEQQEKLAIQFGHSRFVYNNALQARKDHYKNTGKGLSYNATAKMLPVIKQDIKWLKQADSQVLQQKLKDLDRAYQNFFAKRAGYPKFKSKHANQSIRYPQRFKIEENKIYLPKVGNVKIVLHRPMDGIAKNVTVSKTKTGKYFASIQCEYDFCIFENDKPAVGVDVGLKHFAILSTGEKIDHPKYLKKTEKKLAKLQRRLSKKKKGSANRNKARIKVARFHEKIANQRKDFLDKISHRLTTQHGAIGLETLNIKGMVKNHKLAKSISDSGWGMFARQCEYKAVINGSKVNRADMFFPSSKMCNNCGKINPYLILDDRQWICNNCGTINDRDINAAKNLCTVGTTGSKACGDDVRLSTLCSGKQSSTKQEAQRL